MHPEQYSGDFREIVAVLRTAGLAIVGLHITTSSVSNSVYLFGTSGGHVFTVRSQAFHTSADAFEELATGSATLLGMPDFATNIFASNKVDSRVEPKGKERASMVPMMEAPTDFWIHRNICCQVTASCDDLLRRCSLELKCVLQA